MATPIAYGADWSARQIYGDVLAKFRYTDAAGAQHKLSLVLRYADFPGQQHAVLTAAEYKSHLEAGIRSLLIYQRGTHDPMGGEARGREFGHAAVAYARSIGYRAGEPIYACGDAPIGSYDLNVAEKFFRGFAAVVREAGFRAGGYGFRDVIHMLQDRGVVDELWLCGAESGWRPGIAIYQWNNGRIHPAGVEADLVKQFEQIGAPQGFDEGEEHDVMFQTIQLDPTGPDEVREVVIGLPWQNGIGGVKAVNATIGTGNKPMKLTVAHWRVHEDGDSRPVGMVDDGTVIDGLTDTGGVDAPPNTRSLVVDYTAELGGFVVIEATR